MKQYKVLSQKDKWFSGKFDPEKLEQALNSYAQQGWQVSTSVTATIPGGFTGTREEIVIILEREDPRQAEENERQKRLAEAARKTFDPPIRATENPGSGQPTVYNL